MKTLVVALLALAPIIASKLASGGENDRFARHIKKLKRQLPRGFAVIVEPPFVVIGDDTPDAVRGYAESTVRWAVAKLKADFFARDPDEIIDVWLFKDAASYRRNARRFFSATPSTPYGYYSAAHKALVMNIATGGGTLVHEIVHPFMRANFPRCPAWLNEGLGSLFEQSAERRGRIIGRTNWRLAGLQRAIHERRVPSLSSLLATTTSQFYDDDPGTNYAAARYLLYYLQERGLLAKFFSTFRANVDRDPSGLETLKSILGTTDLAAFQKRWEAFVATLTFP
ncbi:MAG: DUF1570 domain-containing protein [Deltaproteobacteria bacterium]|nr:DUF1570 domain-containing protein [Deltaproteobacteria bacterium]